MKNPNSPSGKIEFFPAHPHEGGIGIPANNSHAKVIATSKSIVTQREFNLIVAQESYRDSQGNILGRAIANSSFHHLVDYNWDISQGCPSFVDEPPGKGMSENPQALNDIQAYVKNATLWLANKEL
jgi:hypothetical protein